MHDIFSPTFLVHESLFSLIEPFGTINSASHFFNFQHSDQTIFLRQTSILDHQTRPELHNSASDRPQIRPPYPSTTPDHPQNRKNTNHDNQAIRSATTTIADGLPDQIIPTDHHPWLLISASNQPRITSLLEWYRLGAFLMGWVKGGI